ncbi:arsenic resistance protein [Halosolutus amylolyticus]|uniref:Arsenic resistance protein n=1 Tax=Halosolutus amylolyticus TaxID=2932267 RepID=A0ABD5PNT7_9EURY|nr:bile acid:sodium symporter [Halosolutus amylolyticus]
MIRRALLGIKQNLLYVVVASLALGLLAGQVFDAGTKHLLQGAITPVLFLMVYPMMINIDLKEVLNVRDHLAPVALSLAINFAVAPAIAVVLARLFFAGNPAYAVGLYLIALIPTSGMTAAWTGLADGDLEAALVAMAANLLTAVVVLPAYLSLLVGDGVAFEPGALYRQMALFVVVPMVAGNVTRRLVLRTQGPSGFERLKPLFGGASSLGVMAIVFIAMTMRSEAILSDPIGSAITIVPLVLFYAVLLVVGVAVGRTLVAPAQGIALIYATSMRNLSIAVAIAVASETLPTEAILPIALAYLLQPPLGVVYMHYRRDVVAEGRAVDEVVRSLV